jgi:hypothetical protein
VLHFVSEFFDLVSHDFFFVDSGNKPKPSVAKPKTRSLDDPGAPIEDVGDEAEEDDDDDEEDDGGEPLVDMEDMGGYVFCILVFV